MNVGVDLGEKNVEDTVEIGEREVHEGEQEIDRIWCEGEEGIAEIPDQKEVEIGDKAVF